MLLILVMGGVLGGVLAGEMEDMSGKFSVCSVVFKSDDINIENQILSGCRIETIIIFRVVKIYKYMILDRITTDPEVMSGQPCIRGLRIPVPFILRLLASGKTNSQILKDFPELEEEDIRQALSFASWATTEKTIPVTA